MRCLSQAHAQTISSQDASWPSTTPGKYDGKHCMPIVNFFMSYERDALMLGTYIPRALRKNTIREKQKNTKTLRKSGNRDCDCCRKLGIRNPNTTASRIKFTDTHQHIYASGHCFIAWILIMCVTKKHSNDKHSITKYRIYDINQIEKEHLTRYNET